MATNIHKKCRTVIAVILTWAAYALLTPSTATGTDRINNKPSVISVDYCADQFVLALVEPTHILALSKEAQSPFSFYAERAAGIPFTHGSTEDILMRRPDISVRQWVGTPATDTLLNRAGVKSIPIGFASTPEDNFGNLLDFASKIGQQTAAQAFINKRRALIKQLEGKTKSKAKALYVTPGGFSAGTGTFVNDIINLAGFQTMADTYGQVGWAPLPLEAMIKTPPDVIIASFFDLTTLRSRWSASNHPLIHKLFDTIPVIEVPSRYLSCSGLFAADAAAYIRDDARKIGLLETSIEARNDEH